MKKEDIAGKIFGKIKEEILEDPKALAKVKEKGSEEVGKIAAKATISAIKEIVKENKK